MRIHGSTFLQRRLDLHTLGPGLHSITRVHPLHYKVGVPVVVLILDQSA